MGSGDDGLDGSGSRDELALSRRGDMPTKGSKKDSFDMLGVEDQLNKLEKQDEKSWKTLDSVHSQNQLAQAVGGKYLDTANSSFNNSMDLNDSCASFASFGGGTAGDSSSSLMDSASDLSDHKAAFLTLEPEATPRRKLLQQRTNATGGSSLLKGGSGYRGPSALQLVDEEEEGDVSLELKIP